MTAKLTKLARIPAGLSLEDYAAKVILTAWVLTGSDGLPSNERVLSRAVAKLHQEGEWPDPLQQRIFVTARFDGPEWEALPVVLQRVQSIALAGFNNPGFADYSLKIGRADAIDEARRLSLAVGRLKEIGILFRAAVESAGAALSGSSN